ncbi:hypothetical protein DPMN_028572 [Dreissena polymorpha]|uniref:Uncharacterized protein n=1 Tax=Dreissena polymorpha TaxID=45954 RepID=A0A9D4RG98_DREPO|nr:hypothetical protein DPMN_028572 [Dreissena polymorpha]
MPERNKKNAVIGEITRRSQTNYDGARQSPKQSVNMPTRHSQTTLPDKVYDSARQSPRQFVTMHDTPRQSVTSDTVQISLILPDTPRQSMTSFAITATPRQCMTSVTMLDTSKQSKTVKDSLIDSRGRCKTLLDNLRSLRPYQRNSQTVYDVATQSHRLFTMSATLTDTSRQFTTVPGSLLETNPSPWYQTLTDSLYDDRQCPRQSVNYTTCGMVPNIQKSYVTSIHGGARQTSRQSKVYDGARKSPRKSVTVPDTPTQSYDFVIQSPRQSVTVPLRASTTVLDSKTLLDLYDDARLSPRKSVTMPDTPRQSTTTSNTSRQSTTVLDKLLDRCQMNQDSLRRFQTVSETVVCDGARHFQPVCKGARHSQTVNDDIRLSPRQSVTSTTSVTVANIHRPSSTVRDSFLDNSIRWCQIDLSITISDCTSQSGRQFTTVPDSLLDNSYDDIPRQSLMVPDIVRLFRTLPDSLLDIFLTIFDGASHSQKIKDGARQSAGQSLNMLYTSRQSTTMPDCLQFMTIFSYSVQRCKTVVKTVFDGARHFQTLFEGARQSLSQSSAAVQDRLLEILDSFVTSTTMPYRLIDIIDVCKDARHTHTLGCQTSVKIYEGLWIHFHTVCDSDRDSQKTVSNGARYSFRQCWPMPCTVKQYTTVPDRLLDINNVATQTQRQAVTSTPVQESARHAQKSPRRPVTSVSVPCKTVSNTVCDGTRHVQSVYDGARQFTLQSVKSTKTVTELDTPR